MTGNISIAGLNKADVLAALYNRARPQGMGFLHYDETPMTREQAEVILRQTNYFDYLKGRVMKVSLEGDSFDSWLYNRDNGPDAAEEVIEELRKTGDTFSETSELAHLEQRRTAANLALENMEEKTGLIPGTSPPTYQLTLDKGLKPIIDELLDD